MVAYNGNVAGRAELIRLLFIVSETLFTDSRIEPAQWPALKANTTWGSLPYLEVDGKTLGQSNAIIFYVSNQLGLGGEGEWNRAIVQLIVLATNDIKDGLSQLCVETPYSRVFSDSPSPQTYPSQNGGLLPDGKGGLIRSVFVVSGALFTDNRVQHDNWPALQPNTPWGSVTYLEVDGRILRKSSAIYYYVSNKLGLGGEGEWEKAIVSLIVQPTNDIRQGLFTFQNEDASLKRTKRPRKKSRSDLKNGKRECSTHCCRSTAGGRSARSRSREGICGEPDSFARVKDLVSLTFQSSVQFSPGSDVQRGTEKLVRRDRRKESRPFSLVFDCIRSERAIQKFMFFLLLIADGGSPVRTAVHQAASSVQSCSMISAYGCMAEWNQERFRSLALSMASCIAANINPDFRRSARMTNIICKKEWRWLCGPQTARQGNASVSVERRRSKTFFENCASI
ncbi:hypothetical protein BV898_05246 [Hypsibius exemplaris]|uniref:GST N-terminal domain-containing protein n=1 Tax=Hypsibius exemplaris TaxID=2072580 RepID=A0A1W0X002_HYPEX|nr:hypothetical protein BV898_05246 [Hypsibius exemplaris]